MSPRPSRVGLRARHRAVVEQAELKRGAVDVLDTGVRQESAEEAAHPVAVLERDLVRRVSGPVLRLDVDEGASAVPDSNGAARFIDSETTGRGHRAQDLADSYRQCVIGDLAPAPVLARLVSGGVIAAGIPQFITCVVGAALNNLAWHA